MSALKDYFSEDYLDSLAATLDGTRLRCPDAVRDLKPELTELELKDRVNTIADRIVEFAELDFPELMSELLVLLPEEKAFEDTHTLGQRHIFEGFGAWPLCSIVERHGLAHWEHSFSAMHRLTKAFSAEFAIRPFLLEDTERAINCLKPLVLDQSEHVRRWVSEGTRPRLPWGRSVPALKDYRSEVLALLESLKFDSSEYVRRSISNHLNDLTREDPELVKSTLERWQQDGVDERLIRHALRGLVKSGDPGALNILGFGAVNVEVRSFALDPEVIRVGDQVEIHADFVVDGPAVVDYVVEFPGAVRVSTKVFKWKHVEAGEHQLKKKHSFKPISTRRYYDGSGRFSLQINGEIVGVASFELKV